MGWDRCWSCDETAASRGKRGERFGFCTMTDVGFGVQCGILASFLGSRPGGETPFASSAAGMGTQQHLHEGQWDIATIKQRYAYHFHPEMNDKGSIPTPKPANASNPPHSPGNAILVPSLPTFDGFGLFFPSPPFPFSL